MLLKTKIMTVALLGSALLCASPLAAALKTSSSSARARSAAPVSHRKTKSFRTSSHKSAASGTHKASAHKASTRKVSTHKERSGKVQAAATAKPRFRGQQAIDAERTTEIQQALIREHYLDGEASGEWDQATRDALIRFQGDNHWQTKILPDSRALIKLGLGPSQQNLLNPESAAIAIPYQPGVEKPAPAGSN